MATRSENPDKRDIPRPYTIEPMDAPPPSADPTTAQLKAEIDSGSTGDKIDMFDPGLSPLGTDDEAAGRPPSPQRIATARRQESAARWEQGGDQESYAHTHSRKALYGFIAFIVILIVLFVIAFSMLR